MNVSDSSKTKDRAYAYAFGHCQAWLEVFAASAGLPYTELAIGVAALLHSETSGQVLGSGNSLPPLRGKSSKGNQTLAAVAVARGPYRKTQVSRRRRHMSAAARKKISEAQKLIWAEKKRRAA